MLLARLLLALDPALHLHRVAGDDVADGVGLLLRTFERAAVLRGAFARFGKLGFPALLLGGDGALALVHFRKRRAQGGNFRAAVRCGGQGERFASAQGFRFARSLARVFRQFLRLLEQRSERRFDFVFITFQLFDARALLRDLLVHRADAVGLASQLILHARDIFLVVRDARLQHRHAGFLLLRLCIERGKRRALFLLRDIVFVDARGKLLARGVQRLEVGIRLFELLARKGKVGVELDGARAERFEILKPHGNFQKAQLVAVDEILLRRLRLRAQGFDLQFKLGDLVVDAHQVLLRALELALSLLLAVAEAGNARRLLKDLAAVAALLRQNLVDAALADDGIALAAHAGVHEKLVHIAQPHGLLVDIVFRFAAAVVPARDGDLGLLHAGEDVLGVVEHERHLRKAHLAARFRAAEDDVLHLRAAQRLARLLAHDPADGVRYIRFTASVRADDGGDVLAEVEHRLVRKALEALDLQCL